MQNLIVNKLITILLSPLLLLSAKALADNMQNYSDPQTIFENPERGFCHLISNGESFDAHAVRNLYPGETVGKVDIRLDRFKGGAALDSCFLTNLANSFQTARDAGVKLRVTFTYNYGTNTSSCYTPCYGPTICSDVIGADASINTIENHIAQLAPTLNQYADVIYEIDAGFIGWFGEWHDSTNQNDTIGRHNRVLTAELDPISGFPGNRHITVRRPAYKMNYLQCATCYGSQPRLGYHNQKFSDNSTIFIDPQNTYNQSQCQTFYSNDVSFTANGADAAPNGGIVACNTALPRMRDYHYTLMTAYPDLISNWQMNCPTSYDEMQRKLGYRFQVLQATTPFTAIRGQSYQISVKLKNSGFSKLMNRRAMAAAFNIGSSWAFSSTTLADPNGSDDLRDLRLADTNGIVYKANFTVPASFPTGTAQVYLWLPDYAANLQTQPLFSVQVAGPTWSPSLGANRLHLNTIQVQ